MTKLKSVLKKDIIGWSLYDFANTIYSMNIVSLYLKRYMVEDLNLGHAYFDIPLSISMLLSAILLPALGAISDHSAKKKIFIFFFTFSCCLAVGLMPYIPDTFIMGVILLFIIANFSYQAGQPFYNALLYSVSSGKEARFVSGIGVSLGYVGSVIGMLVVMPFVTGGIFGFDVPMIEGKGLTGAFVPTAIIFFLFALPLFFWVKEREVINKKLVSMRQAYVEVWKGLRDTKKYPGVLRFLVADYFFEDVAATVIVNIGIYCSVVLMFDDNMINLFLIISTISAVFGSFVIGRLAVNYSLKSLLRYIIYAWIVALTVFALVDNHTVIWIIGSVIGISMGGLWTTTRPMLAEMVPKDELGKFFGIFALSGRIAAVVGPLIWTSIFLIVGINSGLGKYIGESFDLSQEQSTVLPYRIAILTLAFVMIIGLIILRKVPEPNGRDVKRDIRENNGE